MVNRENPRILRIEYRPDPGDRHRGRCLWAYFDFDLDHWLLNIQSDCGSAAFGWPENSSESFVEFCSTLHADYLTKKMFRKSVVDIKATIENVKDYLSDMELPRKKRNAAIDGLKATFEEYNCTHSIDLASYLLEDWNYTYGLEIDEAWDLVIDDYTSDEKKIVDIFISQIAPELRAMVQEESRSRRETG